ncbi:hypothetical protein MRX96_057497 [Rhipicephalus microplus]
MTDEPADPPGDFSETTAELTTSTVTTMYNAAGPPELKQRACAMTATQAVNEHGALRACCSSLNLRENSKNTELVHDQVLPQSLHFLLAPSSLTAPQMQAPRL